MKTKQTWTEKQRDKTEKMKMHKKYIQTEEHTGKHKVP